MIWQLSGKNDLAAFLGIFEFWSLFFPELLYLDIYSIWSLISNKLRGPGFFQGP